MSYYRNMEGGSNSCAKLVAQMRNYLLQKEPYDNKYVENIDTAYTCGKHVIKLKTIFKNLH